MKDRQQCHTKMGSVVNIRCSHMKRLQTAFWKFYEMSWKVLQLIFPTTIFWNRISKLFVLNFEPIKTSLYFFRKLINLKFFYFLTYLKCKWYHSLHITMYPTYNFFNNYTGSLAAYISQYRPSEEIMIKSTSWIQIEAT